MKDFAAEPDEDLAMSVVKATDEMRYTLGVMYVPGKLDAHDEFVDDEDLHKSVIDYMTNSDRRLRLQHDLTVQVGTVVEMMRWPYEAKIDLTQKDDGSSTTATLPAGTIYMGVVWDEKYWPDVKSRKLNGFSLGGRAVRVKDAKEAPTDKMNPDCVS